MSQTNLPSTAMQSALQSTIEQHGSSGWDKLWQGKTTPWDHGEASPFLVELLTNRPDGINFPPPGSRALVPGCGTGYDVVAFDELAGYDGWGADLAPGAVEASKLWYASRPKSSSVKAEGGSTSFHQLDFFSFAIPEGGFQLAFDNTFFCALPPSLHPAWGNRYAELLSAPGALLITRCWPLTDKPHGPPWGVSLEEYAEVLGSRWRKRHDAPAGEKGRILVWERL